MESIFGGLIEFKNKNELNFFIENINRENALDIIEMSLIFSLKNGMFSFEECSAIYKCLNKLKNEYNNIPSSDNNGSPNY